MIFRPISFLLLAAALSSQAENLTFVAGGKFSGDLLSITEDKGVAIESPRAVDPVYFRLDAIKNLELNPPESAQDSPFQTERLVISNGDVLPGSLLSLGEETLRFEGPVKGPEGAITISREQLRTLRFGIRPQRLIYSGPAPLSEWTGSGVDKWSVSEDEGESLALLTPGDISQDVSLARQFILKFDLAWQDEPSVRIYFCDNGEGASKSDRYYIDVNHSGIQIKRERSESPHWMNLLNLDSSIEAFDDNQLEVEIRGNRLLGTLDLYLDGELVRQMDDKSERTIGTGLVIVRNKSEQSITQLSNLQTFSWDAVSQIQLLEQPSSSASDSLVDADGKRMTGQLMGLVTPPPAKREEAPEADNFSEEESKEVVEEQPAEKKAVEVVEEAAQETTLDKDTPVEDLPPIQDSPEKEETVEEDVAAATEGEEVEEAPPAPKPTREPEPQPSYFVFKSPYAEGAIEVPADRARIIYFRNAQADEAETPPQATRYQLILADEGVISADDLTLQDGRIDFTHPLLGRLSIPQTAVFTIRNYPPLTDSQE